MDYISSSEYIDQERIAKLKEKFLREFEVQAEVIIRVPGRVNIIGEHIDYCGYAVHPMAIDQDVLVATAKSDDKKLNLKNVSSAIHPDFSQDISTSFDIPPGEPFWWKYFLCGIKGIASSLEGEECKGMNCLVDGQIPSRAGLSSSSALVVAAAMCTVWRNKVLISKFNLAELCASSERFIGTQGGGMDQAIELLAQKGTAKLIEFNPLRTFDVNLPKGAIFVIANSLAESFKAAGTEFNTRVAECRLAAKVLAKCLQIQNWFAIMKLGEVQRESGLTLQQMIDKVQSVLHDDPYTKEEVCDILAIDKESLNQSCCFSATQTDLVEFKLKQRALHVYSEAARVYDFKTACDRNESLERLGGLMLDSHNSCTRLYECSHKDLDHLVELSMKNGSLGARLTGAGWGGCIVALVPETKMRSFIDGLLNDYYKKVKNVEPSESVIFPTQPGQGAFIIKL